MKISVLLPFYNEDKQIPITLNAVEQVLLNLGDVFEYEIICINDGSSDQTADILNQQTSQHKCLHVLHFSRNFGKEAAICAGLDAASGDCVILMDGDLQHPPKYIPEMIELWQQGYDVVEGVKAERQKENAFSRLAANTFYRIFRKLGGLDLKNASDFKLLDKKVVKAWRCINERETFFRGLSAWLGFKRITFEFDVGERTVGTGKWSFRNLLRLSATAITSFSARPLQLITVMGILCVICSLILAIQTLVQYCLGRAAGGFTTVILLQLLIGGAIMVSLGLIGIYLGRIYEEIKGRPRYIISSVTASDEEGDIISGNPIVTKEANNTSTMDDRQGNR